MTTREMKIFAAEIRKSVLYGLDTVKAGHIGGCMSCLLYTSDAADE